MIAAMQQFERFPIDGRPGYFLDGWGYEFFDPDSVDSESIRARLDALLGIDEPPAIVRAVAIDGRRPTAEQIAAVGRELQKAPPAVLQDFRARGGKIEIVPGKNAHRHPLTANTPRHSCGGWFCYRHTLICIAVEADRLATLHEIGHHWDRSDCGPGRFSGRETWRWISGPGPWERRFDSPHEKFAEAFALHFRSAATRDRLGDSIQEFIEEACR